MIEWGYSAPQQPQGSHFNWLITMIAHMQGITDYDLAAIEKAMPSVAKLIQLSVKAKPLLEKLQPLIEQGEPIVKEAIPLVEIAIKEWEVIAPDVLKIVKKYGG